MSLTIFDQTFTETDDVQYSSSYPQFSPFENGRFWGRLAIAEDAPYFNDTPIHQPGVKAILVEGEMLLGPDGFSSVATIWIPEPSTWVAAIIGCAGLRRVVRRPAHR